MPSFVRGASTFVILVALILECANLAAAIPIDNGVEELNNKLFQANPRGVFIESVIVVQFHNIFVTKVDRAYKIQCFYMEAEKTVTSSLDVSMLTTESLTDSAPMPVCTYSVHSGAVDGPVVRFATVGDQVFHVWRCAETGPSPFGMLVHSCNVLDGKGNSVQVVNRDGCAMDPYILGHLSYSQDLLTASREAHVFKFADESSMLFQCQIRLCHKTMGTCQGMTPPKCPELRNRKRRAAKLTVLNEQRPKNLTSKHTYEFLEQSQHLAEGDFDVKTEPMVVLENPSFDADGETEFGGTTPFRPAHGVHTQDPSNMCISRVHFYLAGVFSLAPLSVIICIAVVVVCRWRNGLKMGLYKDVFGVDSIADVDAVKPRKIYVVRKA